MRMINLPPFKEHIKGVLTLRRKLYHIIIGRVILLLLGLNLSQGSEPLKERKIQFSSKLMINMQFRQ